MPATVTPGPPRHLLDAIVVDRPRSEAALAIGGAWVAYMIGVVAGRGAGDARTLIDAALVGAAYVLIGFAAASRTRRLASTTNHARLALLTLAAGTGLGLFNLVANWAITQMHPALRALLVERFRNIGFIDGVVAAPLVEEVMVRLFVMSVIGWLVLRSSGRAPLASTVALIASAIFFASLHLFRPLPLDPVLANYYRAALLAKYTVAGVGLGWVFWRWGLPYSILCHALVNATHSALEGLFF